MYVIHYFILGSYYLVWRIY